MSVNNWDFFVRALESLTVGRKREIYYATAYVVCTIQSSHSQLRPLKRAREYKDLNQSRGA